MDTYIPLLTQLGLDPKESALYIALLELGQAEVAPVAKLANISRSTAYFVFESLEKKGFVSSVTGKKKVFAPIHPNKLLAFERAKVAGLEQALPGLLGLASKHQQKPSVRFFTGKAAITAVYEETLMQEPGSEILAIGHAEAVERSLPRFKDWYIKRRVKQGIRMRAITPATMGGTAVAKRDLLELRKTRILSPDTFTEQVEINIYGTKVSMISVTENELIGVITESKVFANTHRQMFEILWNGARSPK